MIFISYSSRDSAVVRPYCERADRLRLDYWVDYRDLDLNHALERQIEAAILASSVFVVFHSRHSLNSKWVRYEMELAVGSGKPRMIMTPSRCVLVHREMEKPGS